MCSTFRVLQKFWCICIRFRLKWGRGHFSVPFRPSLLINMVVKNHISLQQCPLLTLRLPWWEVVVMAAAAALTGALISSHGSLMGTQKPSNGATEWEQVLASRHGSSSVSLVVVAGEWVSFLLSIISSKDPEPGHFQTSYNFIRTHFLYKSSCINTWSDISFLNWTLTNMET